MQDDADLAALVALRRARLRRRRRPRHRFLLGAFLAAGVLAAAVLAGAAITGRAVIFGACDLHSLRPVTLGENSFLFASDGTMLGVVPSINNRQPLRLDKMSPWLPKASFGTSPELAAVPSDFSNRQDHTMSRPPPRPSLAEPFRPPTHAGGPAPRRRGAL